ncbi:Na+/H+ antiporter subunit E [Brevundimonas sp.]|uniref:Na+/H+ antiporter subunit E n=1 Tax=Brevundimonas sp. TaxID=1871086 RepID=UPI002899A5EB|nr:Na+/H+ antiporter subunit E [Brevundimonas sp.]
MTRVFNFVLPHPILSIALFTVWLLMNSPFGAGSVVIAAVVALLVPQAMRALEPERPRVRNPWAMLKLIGHVTLDIIHSNWTVVRLILGKKRHTRVSGFVRIPLRLNSRFALATLAIIITSTPGTLWVQYDRYRRILLLHVLDFDDEQDWPAIIKNRYEDLLMEIFP